MSCSVARLIIESFSIEQERNGNELAHLTLHQRVCLNCEVVCSVKHLALCIFLSFIACLENFHVLRRIAFKLWRADVPGTQP